MVSHILFGFTLALGLLGAMFILEAVARCPWVVGPEAPVNCLELEFQLFCLGPYLLLGAVAFRWRRRPRAAAILALGAALLFCVSFFFTRLAVAGGTEEPTVGWELWLGYGALIQYLVSSWFCLMAWPSARRPRPCRRRDHDATAPAVQSVRDGPVAAEPGRFRAGERSEGAASR
jgi:hypothetical protein